MKAARRIFLAIAILSAMACSDGGGSSDASADGAADSAMSDGQTHDAAPSDGGVGDDGEVDEDGGVDDGGVEGGPSDDGGPTVMCPDGGTGADPATATEACTALCTVFLPTCSLPVGANCISDCVNDPAYASWTPTRFGRMLECLEIASADECVSGSECSTIVLECP